MRPCLDEGISHRSLQCVGIWVQEMSRPRFFVFVFVFLSNKYGIIIITLFHAGRTRYVVVFYKVRFRG